MQEGEIDQTTLLFPLSSPNPRFRFWSSEQRGLRWRLKIWVPSRAALGPSRQRETQVGGENTPSLVLPGGWKLCSSGGPGKEARSRWQEWQQGGALLQKLASSKYFG